MTSPSWENLDDFLGTDDDGGFAIPAVIHYQAGGTKSITVIFDEAYFNAQLGEYDADASDPRITGKEVDLKAVRRYDRVAIAGKEYDVIGSCQPDGTGMAVVKLAPSDASL